MNLEVAAPLTDSLNILGLGMLGIFIVTIAIIIVITILDLIFAPSKKHKQS